ncbi:MAG: hypothetical protein ACRC7W_05495 [Fusobacteriaceae bacterium]
MKGFIHQIKIIKKNKRTFMKSEDLNNIISIIGENVAKEVLECDQLIPSEITFYKEYVLRSYAIDEIERDLKEKAEEMRIAYSAKLFELMPTDGVFSIKLNPVLKRSRSFCGSF